MNYRKIKYTGDVNLINERRYLINKGVLNENETTYQVQPENGQYKIIKIEGANPPKQIDVAELQNSKIKIDGYDPNSGLFKDEKSALRAADNLKKSL
jgi:hypothetical protein